jgi:tRNA pseudouridine38-40 synthase
MASSSVLERSPLGCQGNVGGRGLSGRLSRFFLVSRLEVAANAFLQHMVRNIAGALLVVGIGDQPVTWIEQVLQARDRREAGATAPAQGLYLTTVSYPADSGLNDLPAPPRPW